MVQNKCDCGNPERRITAADGFSEDGKTIAVLYLECGHTIRVFWRPGLKTGCCPQCNILN